MSKVEIIDKLEKKLLKRLPTEDLEKIFNSYSKHILATKKQKCLNYIEKEIVKDDDYIFSITPSTLYEAYGIYDLYENVNNCFDMQEFLGIENLEACQGAYEYSLKYLEEILIQYNAMYAEDFVTGLICDQESLTFIEDYLQNVHIENIEKTIRDEYNRNIFVEYIE